MSRLFHRSRQSLLSLIVFASLVGQPLLAAGPDVVPEGETPNDQRLQPPKDYDGYFPMEVPATAEAWQQRADQLRRQLLVATGLWPMPAKTPLEAVVHGRVERDGYTVDRVYFQSFPGHYVTGSLYRPTNVEGRLPAVLCPHGHWSNGRFHDHGEAGLKKELEQEAEQFDPSGRHPLQARCVQLARLGCIVFHYDMIGYADSLQLSFEMAHRIKTPRADMEASPAGWGFFSTAAESRQQNILGMQTWNSVRALDWLLSRDDVDPDRIAVTGASGGGTQTFILSAIDPRPAVAFPAVMVSTAMQGGCTCENAALLRVGTGNIEIAALTAPRPLGMTAADDWTKEIETKGEPELRQLYQMLGVPDRLRVAALTQFKHNYNAVSRGVMYDWFNTHLKLSASNPSEEQAFIPLTKEEMTVWNDDHPQPAGGDEQERDLLKRIAAASDKQIAALVPRDKAGLRGYREIVGGAFEAIIRLGMPAADDLEREKVYKQEYETYFVVAGLLHVKSTGVELPVAFVHPKEWKGRVVLWFTGQGKGGMFDADGGLTPEIRKLVEAGVSVASADLIYQGEYLVDDKPLAETPKVKNPRTLSCFTEGYNDTVFVRRVQDVMTLLSFVRNDEHAPQQVDLVGVDGAGPIVAAAGAIVGAAADRVAVDTGGFRFADVESFRSPEYLPGAVKYGDLPALLALGAPRSLCVIGEKKLPPLVTQVYAAAESKAATLVKTKKGPAAVVDWLLAE